ncbi:hypothetical protein B0H19DRAFT_1110590 [Mycena capillaripes]|nr:hypothetical protein B0H19DRAFT_1110590 [Mycena capillaripes]
MARRLMRKLSEACDQLPSSLFITGVNGHEDHPTFAGGFGDIFRASHGEKLVALKRMRYYLSGSDSETRCIRLVSSSASTWLVEFYIFGP